MSVCSIAKRAVASHGCQQKPREISTLGILALGVGCDTSIELGTCWGGTAWFFAQLGLEVTAVDCDLGLLWDQNQSQDRIAYVHADSAPAARDLGVADLVFIDGDHSYEGVKKDWEAWKTKATRLIAFHDIVEHPPETGCKVAELWAEIKRDYPTLEIVDPEGGPWGGIGVVLR